MFCAFDLQSQRSLFFAPEEIAQPLGVIRTLYEEMFPGVDFSEYLKQRGGNGCHFLSVPG